MTPGTGGTINLDEQFPEGSPVWGRGQNHPSGFPARPGRFNPCGAFLVLLCTMGSGSAYADDRQEHLIAAGEALVSQLGGKLKSIEAAGPILKSSNSRLNDSSAKLLISVDSVGVGTYSNLREKAVLVELNVELVVDPDSLGVSAFRIVRSETDAGYPLDDFTLQECDSVLALGGYLLHASDAPPHSDFRNVLLQMLRGLPFECSVGVIGRHFLLDASRSTFPAVRDRCASQPGGLLSIWVIASYGCEDLAEPSRRAITLIDDVSGNSMWTQYTRAER